MKGEPCEHPGCFSHVSHPCESCGRVGGRCPWVFPLVETVEVPLPPHPGAFGVERKHHTHEGVDLYCPVGTAVEAVEAGDVVAVLPFTGPSAGSPWWHETSCVLVEGESGVVLYGEILPAPWLGLGIRVATESLIGNVLRVLRKDKGRPTSMLHLELYVSGTREPVEWPVGVPKPAQLLDPTELLQRARV